MLPGCCFVHCTQASTIARAVSALIAILLRVFLAASVDIVTFASVAGGPACAHALLAKRANTIVNPSRFMMGFLLLCAPNSSIAGGHRPPLQFNPSCLDIISIANIMLLTVYTIHQGEMYAFGNCR